MKKPLIFVFLLLLFLSMISWSSVLADGGIREKPVLKPGTYFVYTARTNKTINESLLLDMTGSGNLFFSLKMDGKTVAMNVYGNGSVEFEVVGLKNDTATVMLTVSGTYAVVRYHGNLTTLWREEDVIGSKTYGNLTITALRSFKIIRPYLLNVRTGEVYDIHGVPYGRSLLFYDGKIRNGTRLFTSPEGLSVSVASVSTIGSTVITYYKKFLPPLLQVKTTPYTVSTAYISANGRSTLIYDPSSGILISYFGFSWADFQAAGFPVFGGIDRSGFSKLSDNTMFAPGLVLGDTNALGETSAVEYSAENSPLVYPYVLLLAASAAVGLWRVKGWGG
ncbi:hypothetical protein [Thermococcus sp. Bubb.Bath]|uniref:hypothetical protein n=1 Tax=Thermococcus sp. Bubb.Bath TaxID=1638242 RepID=UPI00143A2CF7|nr:hypothetical protein [Thermococcus sp. Bubb.Bath]NJF24951.1 hypothetical protein [Thermococcus sp. Bubb.Bath]